MGFFKDRKKITQAQLEAEARARKAALAAERHTDSWLIRLADSAWSWAIVAAILVVAGLLGFLL